MSPNISDTILVVILNVTIYNVPDTASVNAALPAKAIQPNIEVPPVGKAAIIAIAVPTTNTKVTITADQKPLSPAIFINDSPPSPSTL